MTMLDFMKRRWEAARNNYLRCVSNPRVKNDTRAKLWRHAERLRDEFTKYAERMDIEQCNGK